MSEHRSADENDRNGERLSKFLAHAGVASRRHAEELINAGRVQVNGVTITIQGTKIDPAHDCVSVDGNPVKADTEHVYLLLNKPSGYVSTASDPQGRLTVLDLLPPEIRRLRVYPVGRLDIDTSGLILLTNDGDFALRLAHPRYVKHKHYEALVQGYLTADVLEALRTGVPIREDDGSIHKTAPAQVRVLREVGANSRVALTIHEGHKRQVRRMFAAVGYPVRELSRVGVGSLNLKGVQIGSWRHLTKHEVEMLLAQ